MSSKIYDVGPYRGAVEGIDVDLYRGAYRIHKLSFVTNPSKDQFATRVDLEGNLSDIRTNIWSALATILQNAFVQALKRGLDESGQSDRLPDETKP